MAFSSRGLWLITPGNDADAVVINRAYADAERMVSDAAENPAWIEQARVDVEQRLKTFVRALGWNVAVQWN